MTVNNIIILDGGMGRELQRIGAPFTQPLWSAQALMDTPELVGQVHQKFIEAGAQVITTNCYAVVPAHIGDERFAKLGRELIQRSAYLAREEADKSSYIVQVAGCVPPVFGSYKPENFDRAAALERIPLFFEEQEPYANLFLAETIGCVEEALTVIDVYKNFGTNKPLWLALTLEEFFDENMPPRLRSGEDLADALETIVQHNIAQALLLNCSTVEDIDAAFYHYHEFMQAQKSVMFGAYANAFVKATGQRSGTDSISAMRENMSPARYLDNAKNWKQNGARIIGGCCGIGPEYIALLSRNL